MAYDGSRWFLSHLKGWGLPRHLSVNFGRGSHESLVPIKLVQPTAYEVKLN